MLSASMLVRPTRVEEHNNMNIVEVVSIENDKLA